MKKLRKHSSIPRCMYYVLLNVKKILYSNKPFYMGCNKKHLLIVSRRQMILLQCACFLLLLVWMSTTDRGMKTTANRVIRPRFFKFEIPLNKKYKVPFQAMNCLYLSGHGDAYLNHLKGRNISDFTDRSSISYPLFLVVLARYTIPWAHSL
jgi:hypothetical protein